MTFNDSSLPPVLPEDAARLAATVAGSVLLPGDAGYDDERAVFNLNHELTPAVIVVPESVADVQAAGSFAAGQHPPALLWALRGGKGHFAVVTALEFAPFPVFRLYGGALYFPGDRTADVLRAWTDWHPSTPEIMVTSIAVMRMPSMPEVAEPLRGKF